MAIVATITATVAAIGAGFAYAGTAATFSWAAAGIAFGVSLALSATAYALRPEQQANFGSFGDGNFTRQFRQPTPERRYIYGEARASGGTAFIGSTNDNQYLHIVVMLADHEVEEIGEVLINETSIAPDELDGSGFVTTGRYANLVRIKKHLGSASQTADSDLVSEVSGWTSDHTLSGIAYIYVRYEYDRDTFPSGIPNVSAYVRGKKIYDPRDETTSYSSNVALISRDYLKDTRSGFEVSENRIDDTVINDSANTCDELQTVTNKEYSLVGANSTSDTLTLNGENLFLQRGDRVVFTGSNLPSPLNIADEYFVIPYKRNETPRVQLATSFSNAIAGTTITLTTSGTLNGSQKIIKNAEPRYHGGGIVKSDSEIGENLKEILSGMGGRAIYAGGKWRVLTSKYYEPAYYFTEDDIVSTINVTTKRSKSQRFNRIKGVFTSPVNNGNPANYPLVSNSTYETEDGEVIEADFPLPFCQRPSAAQRIAKIELERERQEITFSASFKLTAFQVQAGDNIYFTFERYGWTNKVFEVLEWALAVDDASGTPTPVINMTLQENAEGVYDWNNGEETVFDLAPNTTLPDPFTVQPISGFSLNSFLVDTQGGDKTFKVVASWQEPDNSFVKQGGFYEIEFRRTTDTIYKSAGKVDGSVLEMEIPQLQPDVTYDIRIRAFNNLLASSNYATINNFTVGSTVTTDTEDWENETLTRSGDDWENDTLTSEDWET